MALLYFCGVYLMSKIKVSDKNAKTVSSLEIPAQFRLETNPKLITQAVDYELSKILIPTSHVKNRAEVRGGGKKPWRQKGTGRARAGSIRSPLWRGGGVTFRVKTSFQKRIPSKMHKKAIFMALSQKIKEKKLIIVKDIKLKQIQTKLLVQLLKAFNLENHKILLTAADIDENLKKSARNIPNLELIYPKNLQVKNILAFDYLLIDIEAFNILKEWGKNLGK